VRVYSCGRNGDGKKHYQKQFFIFEGSFSPSRGELGTPEAEVREVDAGQVGEGVEYIVTGTQSAQTLCQCVKQQCGATVTSFPNLSKDP